MQASDWPIWSLLHTVFGSILEVGILCVAGYMLARQGILDRRTQKHVNRLNVALFTPSLLFSKVAFFLTPEKLRELWTIPILFGVTTVCSMLVAYVFGSIMRLKKSQRNFAMAAAMFMNSNSLPVALMQSMVYSVEALRWGDDDNEDAMLGRALTYLVLYSTLGMMLRWSYGVHLLSQADDEPIQPKNVPQRLDEATPLIHAASTHPQFYSSDQRHQSSLVNTRSYNSIASTSSYANYLHPSDAVIPHDHRHYPVHVESRFTAAYFTSFPNTPMYSLSESDLASEEDVTFATVLSEGTCCGPALHQLRVALRKVNSFMTVPMWAALASVIVACVRPLQHALEEHLQPVKFALSSAGNCSIPLTLVVLGAYFHAPKPAEDGPAPVRTIKPYASDQSLGQSVRQMFVFRHSRLDSNHSEDVSDAGTADVRTEAGETRTVVVAVLSRMVLTPLILLPLLTLFIASGANHLFDDPVFALANVLLITSAPALTLAQITQAASGDAFERLISRTVFWAYCVLTPISTIISVMIGLLLAKV